MIKCYGFKSICLLLTMPLIIMDYAGLLLCYPIIALFPI